MNIEFVSGSIEDEKKTIMYSLSNLKHFILPSRRLVSINSQLAQYSMKNFNNWI